MKTFARADRVSGHLQKVLAEVLRKKISDPRLTNVTITGVEMSRDLRIARIYYVTSGDNADKADVEKALKRAKGYVKRTLAKQLGLRYMPDLKFFYDNSFDYGSNIETLLASLKTDNGKNHSTAK
ncbi:MAG: 30S ribosome-binding factor RbfA [Desulfobacterales bacterium]|nr:30S ribosome-binding factor RbfA [Desulfobacterales bacterium]MDJ0912699.1 30S ribosome-binding factor RbfA [Desulfobacterales bacterium]